MGLENQWESKQGEQPYYRHYLPEWNFNGQLKRSKPNWQKSRNAQTLVMPIRDFEKLYPAG